MEKQIKAKKVLKNGRKFSSLYGDICREAKVYSKYEIEYGGKVYSSNEFMMKFFIKRPHIIIDEMKYLMEHRV